MHKQFILRIIFIITLGLFLSNCNEESYIQGQGTVEDVGTNPQNKAKGRITFWTSDGFNATCSNGLIIYINGSSVGAITEISTAAPTCGTNSNKTVTVILEEGTYSFSASGTGTYCRKYNSSVTIEKNTCSTLELQ